MITLYDKCIFPGCMSVTECNRHLQTLTIQYTQLHYALLLVPLVISLGHLVYLVKNKKFKDIMLIIDLITILFMVAAILNK